jgi:predicted DCC family thiol-disulfide oxidoreductase YuxK
MRDDQIVLLFDGGCNLCDWSVQFVLDHDKQGHIRFASLQSEVGRTLLDKCKLDPDRYDSVVLYEFGKCHVRSEAGWRVATHLALPWRWLAVTRYLPRKVRDTVYDWVARNRFRWFGTRGSCRVPTAETRDRFLDAGGPVAP